MQYEPSNYELGGFLISFDKDNEYVILTDSSQRMVL